jgi:hypothetical protein
MTIPVPNLHPICSAISLHIADWGWGRIDSLPSDVLNHWFFVIGNGIEIESGSFKPGSASIYSNKYVHEFPGFERLERNLPRLKKKWLAWETNMQRMFLDSVSPDKIETLIQNRVNRHRLVRVEPEDLTAESILKQIERSLDDPRRMALGGEYLYARPYPLSEHHSNVYFLTEETPLNLLWVAQQFCEAWSIYLNRDLEEGRFFTSEQRSYADEEWTRKHAGMIGDLSVKLKGLLERCNET